MNKLEILIKKGIEYMVFNNRQYRVYRAESRVPEQRIYFLPILSVEDELIKDKYRKPRQ